MNLYVETSGLLSWLFGESNASAVASHLGAASSPIASELTFAECLRAATRLEGRVSPLELDRLLARLRRFRAACNVVPVNSAILAQVGRRFPVEPVRTLDAIHLCTAADVSEDLPGLHLLSLDRRVRDNGLAMGFPVVP